jgi:carboxylate-amine ligase
MAYKHAGTPAGGYSLGIEEEYFLADAHTFEVPADAPKGLFNELRAMAGGQAGRELLQAQMEVRTAPSASCAESRAQLRSLRWVSAEATEKQGLVILASGTHPMARWREVSLTPSERYLKVMESLRMIGRRDMVCGMHVHVELPDPHRRVDVMTRMIPYLPLFIALSASSPFWQGHETGLMSYRLASYDELPRSGIPDLFESVRDYENYVTALVASGSIEDASYIWWAIRPSHNYPTLELRAPDVCTRLDDAIALACLYRALARHLFRTPGRNRGLKVADRAIAVENKWSAQRYGIRATLAARDGPRTVAEFLNEVIAMTAEDAAALGCAGEIEHCRSIISAGTSAEAQLSEYWRRKHESSEAALKAAAEWIARHTLAC